jgi:GT2 family glycosyltransferase
MTQNSHFNYIITIHNKEDLIKEVLTYVLICCRQNSTIYPVLDGCTDSTETIVDDFIQTFSHIPITKVYTPDVHEIRAINAGLKAANQDGQGYNIILQDDVLLQDFLLEETITQLYEWAGPQLGFVSFRHGANLSSDILDPNSAQIFTDHVENAYGHGIQEAGVLLPGQLAYRTISIKSPVCIPFELVRKVGLLEERLAPYMCDDIEYSIRCAQAGYRNAVFGIRFQSDVEWGTTRTKPDSRLQELEKRNIQYIKQWHSEIIAHLIAEGQVNKIVDVPEMATEQDRKLALQVLERNRAQLQNYLHRQKTNLLSKAIQIISEFVKKYIRNRKNFIF